MSEKINIVIVGSEQDVLDKQLGLLSMEDASYCKVIFSKVIDENISLNNLDEHTILIINLTQNAVKELSFLETLTPKKVVIIVGDQSDAGLLSRALRLGVKDFIDSKTYQDNFVSVI